MEVAELMALEQPATLARGTVVRVLGGVAEVRVDERLLRATPLAGSALGVGDRVVVARAADETFVLGVLEARRAPVVQARDAAGRLLFEHDPEHGQSVLHVPRGDLRLRAEQGAIELEARDGVRLRAAGSSSVEVSPGGVRVVAPVIDAAAGRAEGTFADTKLVTRTLAVAAERAVSVVGLLETRAHRIVERAKTSYREVEDLAQVRAGRIRSVARGTIQMLGQRAVLRAVKDFKILGDKIHLA